MGVGERFLDVVKFERAKRYVFKYERLEMKIPLLTLDE